MFFGLTSPCTSAVRVAAVYDQRDSFTDNIGPSPSQPGDMANSSQRVQIAWNLFDGQLETNWFYEHFDWETDNNAVKRRGDTVSTDPVTSFGR